jgi:hypothetical protein
MVLSEVTRAMRDAKLDALHDRLTGAVEQLVSGQDWRRTLEFASRFRSRSFGNTLLIWSQHLDAFEKGLVPDPGSLPAPAQRPPPRPGVRGICLELVGRRDHQPSTPPTLS